MKILTIFVYVVMGMIVPQYHQQTHTHNKLVLFSSAFAATTTSTRHNINSCFYKKTYFRTITNNHDFSESGSLKASCGMNRNGRFSFGSHLNNNEFNHPKQKSLHIAATQLFTVTRGGGASRINKETSLIKAKNSLLSSSSSSASATKLRATNDNNNTASTAGAQHQRRQLLYEMIAEFVGTCIIVQIGTGSIMSSMFANSLIGGLFPIAIVWMIGVIIAIHVTASISGAHLNPAISIAMAMFRSSKTSSFHWGKVIPYCLAQVFGAMFGSYINYQLYGTMIQQYEIQHNIVRSSMASIAAAKVFGEYISAGVTTVQAFLTEAYGTAILSSVIFSITHPKNQTTKGGTSSIVPTIIGLTVAALICTLAPLTQGGFNPARDFGPRIIAYIYGWNPMIVFQKAWLYILAPIVGAIIGAMFVETIYSTKTN